MLPDACLDAGLDFPVVAQKLASAMKDYDARGNSHLTGKKSPSQLIDSIVAKHHIFTVQEIERLTPLMEKVCMRHGEQHPELFKLQTIFLALSDSLIPHMRKEENVLFLYIQQLESSSLNSLSIRPQHFGTVENPIRMMMADHEEDGERLRIIHETSSDYTLARRCVSKLYGIVRRVAGLGKGFVPSYSPRKQRAISIRSRSGTKCSCECFVVSLRRRL